MPHERSWKEIRIDLRNGSLKAVHVLGIAYCIAAFAGLVVYGDNVVADYMSYNCSSPFYKNLKIARSTSLGLFVVSIFVIFVTFVSAKLEYISSERFVNRAVLLGIAGFVISGLIAIEVVLGGSCDVPLAAIPTPVNDTNSGNENIGVCSGLLLGLATVLGILAVDFIPVDDSVDGTTHIRAQRTSYDACWNWAVRMTLGVALVTIMSETNESRFRRKFIDAARYNTPACAIARRFSDAPNSDLYKHYYLPIRLVNLDNYNATTGAIITSPPSSQMYALAACVMAALVAEGLGRCLEMYMTLQHLHTPGNRSTIFITRFLALFSYVSFGLFVSSFVLSNAIVACPIFDPNHSDILQWAYVSMALFYGSAAVHVALFERKTWWALPIINKDKDGNEAEVTTTLTEKLFADTSM